MPDRYQLPRSTPEKQGISSKAILQFVDDVEKSELELHSFMLLRHGQVVSEGWWSPYAPERPHMLFSLSKSFTSTAVGLAVSEGLLSVDDKVVAFFPEDLSAEIGENLAAMCVKHLLCMGTGHAEDTTGHLHECKDGNWVKAFLELPVEYEPGTHFVYNSGATYMLSAIVQKVTGMTILDYLTPRLFAPLGIEGPTWEVCSRGINTGGWGLKVKTEDILRFGKLYLQKGLWEGKRIISEEWVKEATTSHISNNGTSENQDWQQGYCYQFWRCQHNAYRGDGAFGQYCIVMEDQDAVLAITSGLRDMQAVLDRVWKYLLPAMEYGELPEDTAAYDSLVSRLRELALTPPEGHYCSPVIDKVSGKPFVIEENDQNVKTVSFNFQDSYTVFTLSDNCGEHKVCCGNSNWIECETSLPGDKLLTAASGTWTNENTYTMTLRFYETPFNYTVTASFDGENVSIESSANVSLWHESQLSIKGCIA